MLYAVKYFDILDLEFNEVFPLLSCLYSQQQNKWYPEECSEFTCTYNNITKSYYGKVNSLRLKWSEASKWASKNF